MSNNNDPLIDNDNNNKIEPFDKIEQGTKKYIPNIPSVISDMKKNNIYHSEINNDNSTKKSNKDLIIEPNEDDKIKNNDFKETTVLSNQNNNNNDISNTLTNYWNTFRNNKDVSIFLNPFQDDGECVNKIYKIYSCITITLVLIVIVLSITLS